MIREPSNIVTHAPELAQIPPVPPAAPVGLGDAMAKIADPIARILDRVTGSRISGCAPCAQRKAALNELVPNILKPLNR